MNLFFIFSGSIPNSKSRFAKHHQLTLEQWQLIFIAIVLFLIMIRLTDCLKRLIVGWLSPWLRVVPLVVLLPVRQSYILHHNTVTFVIITSFISVKLRFNRWIQTTVVLSRKNGPCWRALRQGSDLCSRLSLDRICIKLAVILFELYTVVPIFIHVVLIYKLRTLRVILLSKRIVV